MSRLSLLAVIAFAACHGPEAGEPEDSAPVPDPEEAEVAAPVEGRPAGRPGRLADPSLRTATTGGGSYVVRWRPIGGEVPRNEHFALEAWLFRTGPDGSESIPGAILAVSGWMPDHGHGMVRQPRSVDLGDGHYRVEGMLLHMAGHWELYVDVIDGEYSERAVFELDL